MGVLGQVEHVQDHVQGEARGEVVDDIDAAGRGGFLGDPAGVLFGVLLDQCRRVPLDDREQRLELPAYEFGGDDVAEHIVLLAVVLHQRRAKDGADPERVRLGGVVLGVLECGHDIVVALDHPAVRERVVVERVVVAEDLEGGVGVVVVGLTHEDARVERGLDHQ